MNFQQKPPAKLVYRNSWNRLVDIEESTSRFAQIDLSILSMQRYVYGNLTLRFFNILNRHAMYIIRCADSYGLQRVDFICWQSRGCSYCFYRNAKAFEISCCFFIGCSVPNWIPDSVSNCLPDSVLNWIPDPVVNCLPEPVVNCLPEPVGKTIGKCKEEQ